MTERDPLLGRLFNSYEIVAPARRGAAGQIYRAQHRFLGGVQALKVLTTGQSHPQVEARFLREAQAARKIRHPNIVEVLDFGRSEDGMTFLVMEWLEGESLGDALAREAPFRPSRIVSLARQIASGLKAAHEAGLVHRDLKPANIMLTGPNREQVKIVDFGLVRDHAAESREGRLTEPGMLLGTPWYMAPELIREDPVSAATDIYALGAIMFEMLTARVPFSAASLPDIFAMHLKSPLPPMPRVWGIERIIARCLQKRAEDRPKDAAEVLAALDRVVVEEDRLEAMLDANSQEDTALVPALVVPADASDTVALKVQSRSENNALRAVVISLAIFAFVAAVLVIGSQLRDRSAKEPPKEPPKSSPRAVPKS